MKDAAIFVSLIIFGVILYGFTLSIEVWLAAF